MRKLVIGILGSLWFMPVLQAADEPLVLYSGRSDTFIRPVVESFSRETGIKVVLHAGKSTALLNKLNVEGQRTAADLFISNDAGTLQKGTFLQLFRPLPAALLAGVPANYRAADNTWTGLSARARVLVVNTKAKSPAFVKSVFDLADPRLKGRLGITNSTNESFIAGVTVYQQAAGDARVRKWLEGIKANAAGEVFAKHSKIVKAVAEGRKDIGLVNHYYIYRHLDKHPDAPIRILLPDQGDKGMGVAWNVAGVAISRHSRKPDQAERLVAYLLSAAGQQQFAAVNREYPVLKGVPAAAEVPPAGSYRIADVPMAVLGWRRNATLDLLDDVGMP